MDLQRLADQLGEAFPEAEPTAPLAILGEGFGSLVVETTGGVVFRVARHAAAQRGHRRERLILPIVRRAIADLRVPRFEFWLESSAAFPFGVVGYVKLPGRPLAPDDLDRESFDRLAGQVAGF
jgi:hypothetical protein